MSLSIVARLAAAVLVIPGHLWADGRPAPLPKSIFNSEVEGMPSGAHQQIRVMTAEVGPGRKTVHHTHPFPVTTYILAGSMTFGVEGEADVTVVAGQAFVEHPGLRITGRNPSETAPAHMVMFYVSDPSAAFLDVTK